MYKVGKELLVSETSVFSQYAKSVCRLCVARWTDDGMVCKGL